MQKRRDITEKRAPLMASKTGRTMAAALAAAGVAPDREAVGTVVSHGLAGAAGRYCLGGSPLRDRHNPG